jgi:hypothetical protein
MEFGKKKFFILCVNLFIMLLFFEIKIITLCDEPSFFFVKLKELLVGISYQLKIIEGNFFCQL